MITFRLGEIANVATGQSAPQQADAFSDFGTPFLRAGSLKGLTSGKGEDNFEKLTFENAKKFSMKLFPTGTVLFAKSGMSSKIGRVYQLKKESYLVSHLAGVIPNSEIVSSDYLQRWFEKNSPGNLVANESYPSIRTSDIKNLKIPLPPLAEQRRIAAILDKADAIRRKRQKAIALTDTLLKSVFLDMFGDPITNPMAWERKQLGSITNIVTGGTPDRTKPEYYSGGIPWVKTKEVKFDFIATTAEKISKQGLDNSNCKLFPIETILIAMYGQGRTRGRSGILAIPAATNQACAAILPTDSMNHIFLFELLKLCYKEIRGLGRGGNQPNLNLSLIKTIPIISPPGEIQTKLHEFWQNQHKILIRQEAQLMEHETLLASLTQRAFRGELTATETDIDIDIDIEIIEANHNETAG